MTIFGIFDELLSTQNVNAARFARNVECDIFCDFSNTVILSSSWTNNHLLEEVQGQRSDIKNAFFASKIVGIGSEVRRASHRSVLGDFSHWLGTHPSAQVKTYQSAQYVTHSRQKNMDDHGLQNLTKSPIFRPPAQCVKIAKKSHSTLRAKRATFTF